MSPEDEITDMQVLYSDVYLNYDKLNTKLQKAFPAAFTEFHSSIENELNYPACFFVFFQTYNLMGRIKETEATNKNYAGTFSYCFKLKRKTAVQLGRAKRDIGYYGINTKEKAIQKMVEKGFEIIECLLTGKEMPEKLRRS